MQIYGDWFAGSDGVLRPIIRAEVLDCESKWRPLPFLVDTGADGSVLSADALEVLRLNSVQSSERIVGVGGLAASVVMDVALRLTCEDGGNATFHGRIAALTDPRALDVSVLGRDIIGLFALIVDQPGDRVCLLRDRHTYEITRR